MKKIIILYLFLFALLSNLIAKQSFVRIKVIGSQHNTVVYTSNFDESFFQSIEMSDVASKLIFDTNIDIPIYHKSEIFFHLRLNNETGALLTVTPGDSITIIFERDKLISSQGYRNYKVTFEGSNSIAHQIYRERFNPISKNYTSLNSAIEKAHDALSYFSLTESAINKKLLVWDSLKQNNLINEYCYKLYYNDTKAALNRYVLTKLLSLKKYYDSSSWNKQLYTLRSELYSKSEANRKYLLKTFVGAIFHRDYLNHVVYYDATIKDTLLKSIYDSYFYLYDTLYREKAWGSWILHTTRVSALNELEGDKTSAIVFAKYYPKSIYLKKRSAIIDSVREVRMKNSTSQEINKSFYSSLKEIFNLKKDRFFFVDIWATWCAPCIGEFAYTTQLDKKLDSLNIKKIYLSIDEKADSTRWETLIKKYYLNGSHYIVGRDIQVDILKRLLQKNESGGLTIPHYFVYDKLKDKFYMNLSRPSSEGILYEELNKIVTNID